LGDPATPAPPGQSSFFDRPGTPGSRITHLFDPAEAAADEQRSMLAERRDDSLAILSIHS